MQADPTLTDRILARFDDLSPTLRRAAVFVAKHPDDVATRSLRYLAGITDMTPATFSRLAAALGYGGYEELRDSCRDGIRMRRLRFSERADALQRSDTEEPGKGRFVFRQGAAAIHNINTLLDSVDLQMLDAAAARLVSARQVILVGAMSSRPIADYMAYVASMAFGNWQVFRPETGSAAAQLVDVDERDATIVICNAPYARMSIEAAKHLGDRGSWVIGISDEVLSPLHPHCDVSWIVSMETPQFFSSHVATLVLIESLIGIVIAKGGESVSRRVAGVESTSHEIGEYLQRPEQ